MNSSILGGRSKIKVTYYWNPGDIPCLLQKKKISLGQSCHTTLAFFDVRKSCQVPACQVSLEVKVEETFLQILYTNILPVQNAS